MDRPDPKTMMNNHKQNKAIQVLHIDDEVDFLTLSKDYIERLSNGEIQLNTLSDPSQALEALKSKKYDVIVCDYLMPAVDGLDIINKNVCEK